MKGTKRLGTSDSNSGTHDSIFQSKRMMVGTQFDLHRAEPSQQQSVEAPPLDKRQAESSRQHVRALNTQFASWVQTQLQNHPDELWEDGVQDYLTHASNIMEKFSEVINWLKANSAKAENFSALGSQSSQKKLFPESKDNNVNSFLDKPGIPPARPTAGFVPSGGNPMQNKFVSESKDNEIKAFSEKPEIAPTVMSGGFGTSWAAPVPNKLFPESKDNEIKSFSKTSGVAPAATSSVFGTAWAPPVPKKLDTENKDNEIKSFSKTPGIAPAGISPAFGMASGPVPKKLDTENKDNEIKTFSEKPGITPAGSTTGFAMPWSSGPVFSGQTSFSFGSQSSIPVSHAVSNDGDGEDDVEQPSSPSVKKTEEKGVIVVHEMKCKLYVKSSDPADKDAWKDKGTGQLYIKCKEGVGKGAKESKPTILVRNDAGRVVLNALLYPGIKTNMQKNSIVAIFHTSDDDDNVVARTFLIRAKSEEDRNKLASIIQEYAPAA